MSSVHPPWTSVRSYPTDRDYGARAYPTARAMPSRVVPSTGSPPRAHPLPIPQLSPTLMQLEKDIRKLDRENSLTLRIAQLPADITPSELRQHVLRFGNPDDITREKIAEPNIYSATIRFGVWPEDIHGLLYAAWGSVHLPWKLEGRQGGWRSSAVFASELQLGLKLAENAFQPELTARDNVIARFWENRKIIKITFERQFSDKTIEYHIEMKIQDLKQGCIRVLRARDTVSITIELKHPAIYYRFDPELKIENKSRWSVGQCLRRVIDIPPEGVDFDKVMGRPKDSAEQRPKEPVEPNSSRNYAKLGKCTMIRFTANRAASRKVDLFINKANSYGLLAPAPSTMTIQPQLSLELPYQDLIPNLAFDVRYLLEAALSFNYILVSDITPKFASILCSMDPSKAATILEQAVGSRSRIWNPTEHLIAKENKLSRTRMRTTRTIPPQCVYLRKVIVTPTTMYLHPPTVETSNRVIRQYSDLSDYFLRVEFADEGLSKLWSKGQTGYALFTRIFSILDQGIKIGNRTYEFLAFSSSQLRENAVWLFCRKQGSQVTADSIRRWMGDFSHIKSAAKYSARMGQCFSSTREIAHLTSSEVELVNDIENKKYVFSDGCGKLSAALAEKISVELEKMVPPSAFQIRLGGAKGVLAVSPDLKGNHVQIRPSMKKFDVDFHVLEVIKVSAYAPCFLNRQIIILITALGVPDKVIWGLKDKMIQELEEIETDDDTAIRMLYHNWDEGGPTEMMMKLIKAGFLKNGDPFIKNLLTLFKLQLLEELPRRARIFVPDGAFLLGVVDETAQLQEGEIFVQISSAEDPTRRRVVTGKCAVVRSPCFHPGDVRLVTAVDCPALRHLHDVVVFNTKGPRSLPSMCSGGDLDGDDYTIIWDPDIVGNIKEYAPMDYTGREKPSDTAVNIYEVKKFFVNYALANNLGLIANAHLAMSDYLERGPLNRKCIMLAHLHSDAVDFPKSGVAVELDDELRPSQYPDFMEKPSDRTYASGNILGRIFRECKPSYDYEPKDYENSLNELFLIDGYEEYLDEARELKEVYDHDIQSLMNQYGVRSDLEIVSGFIMGTDIVTSKREYEIHKSISGAYSGLRRMYRKQFDKGLKSADLRTNQDHEIEKKAAAWYVASYERIDSEQMYSFAWVVWDVLCKLANRLRIGSSDHRIPELEGHNGSIIIIGEDGKPRLLNDERPTKAKDHLMTDGAKPFGLEPELKHGNGHGTKEQSNGHLIEPSPLQESNASTGLDTLFMDMCLGSNDSSSTDYDRNNIGPYNKDMTISGMATSGLSNIDNYKSSNSNNRSSNNNSSSGSNDKGKGKNKWNSDRCSALKGPVNSSVSSNSTHSSCGTTGYLSPTGSVATSESLDYNTSKTSSWSDIFKINSGTSSNTSTSSSSSSNTSSSSSTWPNTWPNTKTSSNSSSNKDHSSISETIDFLFSEESESTEYLTGIKSWESIFQDNDDHNNNNDNDDHNNNNDNDDYNNNNDYDDINQNDKPARISSDCGGGGRNSPKFNNHVTQHDGYICIGPDVNDEELKKALMF